MIMETPSQEIFDLMKKAAISIWDKYDDEYGYATEKIERVNSLDNIQDNAMVFYRMFDYQNQAKMLNMLPQHVLDYISNNY